MKKIWVTLIVAVVLVVGGTTVFFFEKNDSNSSVSSENFDSSYVSSPKSSGSSQVGSSNSSITSSNVSSSNVSDYSNNNVVPDNPVDIPIDSSYQSTADGYMSWTNSDFQSATTYQKNECADIYANEMRYDRADVEALSQIFANNPDNTLSEIITYNLI